jgi:hypothetical protein
MADISFTVIVYRQAGIQQNFCNTQELERRHCKEKIVITAFGGTVIAAVLNYG